MRGILLSSALTVGLLAASAASGAEELRIRHAEPIAASAADLTKPGEDPGIEHLAFQAYGRQFDLALERNERLLRRLSAAQKTALQRYPAYRGKLTGVAGSWVRLTRIGRELHGAFWDGTDLYTVAPAHLVAPHAAQPLGVQGAETVIYRLADTESVLDKAFCGVGPQHTVDNATARFKALPQELRTALAAAGKQIEVAFIADVEFRNRFPTDTEGQMLARINVVDGIFSEQVGVTILAPELRVFAAEEDPFTGTDPDSLLDQMGRYREGTPAVRTRGLAHLMTGRNLDGTTAGIAYVASLCEPFGGVGLSESDGSVTTAALIAAHELGHNFGASHDGQAGSPCESTPQTFIMAPRINGSTMFSQCSLDRMLPSVQTASCITAAAVADAAVAVPAAAAQATAGTAFDLRIDVNSVGAAQANSVVVTATLSTPFTVESAAVTGGTCTPNANTIGCDLGAIPAGSTRRIDLRLNGSTVGTSQVNVTLASPNDSNAQNNSASVAVTVSAAPPPPPPSSTSTSKKSGGGALGWWMLAPLAGLVAWRRREARG